MSKQLETLSESVKCGRYKVAADKVAAAIMEWYVGDHLGDEGLRLRLQLSPTGL